MTTERTHWEVIFYNGNQIVIIQEYDFDMLENRVWHIRNKISNKFVKVFEVKDIYENGHWVDVEIKEEEV